MLSCSGPADSFSCPSLDRDSATLPASSRPVVVAGHILGPSVPVSVAVMVPTLMVRFVVDRLIARVDSVEGGGRYWEVRSLVE